MRVPFVCDLEVPPVRRDDNLETLQDPIAFSIERG